jgi:hypothetical protein
MCVPSTQQPPGRAASDSYVQFNSLTKSGPLSHLLLSEPFLPQPFGGTAARKCRLNDPLATDLERAFVHVDRGGSPTLSGCRSLSSMAQTSWAVALTVGGVIDQELPVDSKNG